MRVLIVKTTSMGDVVHTLPAVTDMAALCPGIEIDWLVEKPFAAIADLHPAVRQVIPIAWRKWRKNLLKSATRLAISEVSLQLRAERYDLVLDFQGLLKSVWWARKAKSPVGGYDWGSAREPVASLFYDRKSSVSTALHAVVRSRRLAALQLGYAMPTTAAEFGIQAGASQWLAPEPRVVLIPCASRPEKLWPLDGWRTLVKRCELGGKIPVIMWGTEEEKVRAHAIAAGTCAVVPPFLTVADSAALLAGANAIVGLDTGFTHLGAAFGRNTIGIYCDHEPGLAGVTGSGRVLSFGGRAQIPAQSEVLVAFENFMS